MAYDWPDGWNETRTEKAVQQWICDLLDVPKYAVRCAIDNEHRTDAVVQIFKPLTGTRTELVHQVFGRLEPFAEHVLRVDVPEEKTAEHTYRMRRVYIWSP